MKYYLIKSLINGNSKGNIALKDQDVIKIEPYEIRVELNGFVKRDGFFELLPKENLRVERMWLCWAMMPLKSSLEILN
jgi:hypothetical protein